jgi:Domain of unknown function (DUF4410)
MKVRTCSALIVAMMLLIGVAGATIITDDDRHANFYSYKTYSWGKVQPTVVVLRFTVQSQLIADSPTLSSQACTDPGAVPDIFTVDPKLLDEISNELQQRLSKKKMSVMVDPDPKTIPDGGLVISGCIFKADKGRAIGRMIGLDVGESRLGAHIVFLSKGETGVTPLDSFDLQVKGTWATGLAVDAAEQPRESLRADGRKLVNRIVKKLNSSEPASGDSERQP